MTQEDSCKSEYFYYSFNNLYMDYFITAHCKANFF